MYRVLFTFSLFLLLPISLLAESSLYVEIQRSKLRGEAKHFSTPLADLKYGDRLELLRDLGDWKQVRLGSQNGYVHESAVTRKVVVVRQKGVPVDADIQDGEIVLAGKGFNKDIEKEYGQGDGQLNYEDVDFLESIRIESQVLGKFLRAS